MMSSFRGKFETNAKLNGVTVAHCSTPNDVIQYLLRLAERNQTDKILAAPPPFPEEHTILEGLRHEGIHCLQEDLRRWVLSPCIGITGAVSGIAETGSLLLSGAQESTRLVCTLSAIHVAVVPSNNIAATLEDAISLWDINAGRSRPSQWLFISGPSKTLSIEQTPVPGVQGPREVHVLITGAT